MKMTFKTLAAMCALTFGLTGCTNDSGSSSSDNASSSLEASDKSKFSVSGIEPVKEEEILSSTDCKINFSDSEVKGEGIGAEINGNVVTIMSPGVYELTGSSSDAKIIIEAEGADVKLLLNGINLTSQSGAVIDCESAKLLTICSVGNTKNVISDTVNYTFPDGDDEPDAAIFSRSDTAISGSGELVVNGLYKDAIKCKDGLSISCGKLIINAEDDGITGKDYTVVYDGDISITSGGDGIKSTNSNDEALGYVTIMDGTINIACMNDGIQAENLLTISGGNISVKAGGDVADEEITASSSDIFDRDFRNKFFGQGGSSSSNTESSDSCKGLKADGDISISGGEFNITSADDCIHSNSSVTIDNGTFELSSCDDGIHADESLVINGGTINITKSYEGLEGKNITISGGTICVRAVDDGINAAGGDNGSFFGFGTASSEYYISISGGEITINADGDGIDSNGTIAQSGGTLTIYGPTNSANGAIDYESSYALSGGTLIALGAQGMAQAPSALSQPCLSITGNVSANSTIEIRDANGNMVLSTTTPKACQSLIFSCEDFVSGSDYQIYANNTLLKTVTATDGVAGGGTSGNGFGGMGGGRFNPDDFAGEKPDKNNNANGSENPFSPNGNNRNDRF